MVRPLLQLVLIVALVYGGWLVVLRAKAALAERRAALRGPGGLPGPERPFDVIVGGDGEGRVIPLHEDPYALLGVDPDADDAEVESAYRRLLEQNAPERVHGMSDEIQRTAERMTRRIEQAYAEVRRMRGG